MKFPEKPLLFPTRAAWRAWLEQHHATATEAWLLHYKMGVAKQSVRYQEAVEEALCFGWIDSTGKSVDAEKFVLRYSPRKRRSVWSESNKQRVAKLIREGRMTPAGLAKIEEAKASGEWDTASAREDVSAVPADLATALKRRKGAWKAFEAWAPSRKKMYLHWISSAKRAETREKRIRAVVEMAAGKEPPVSS
jgi:uncharacterized protein YdeI (YjbR/CyaY-like superfamily)